MTREEEIIAEYEAAENRKLSKGEKEFILNIHQWADKHPKNPWRDAKNDPPKDTNTVVAVFKKYSIFEKWLCSYSPEEKIWDMSDIICDPPDYWMPIPKTPRVSKTIKH